MRKLVLLLAVLACFSGYCQVGINTDGSDPDGSAMLDVKSTTHGVLVPRHSAASRDLIPSPANGLIIFNTTTSQFDYFNGSHWYQLESTFISSVTGALSPGGVSPLMLLRL